MPWQTSQAVLRRAVETVDCLSYCLALASLLPMVSNEEKLKFAFHLFDRDNSGEIDQGEFRAMVKCLLVGKCTDAKKLDQLLVAEFQAADENGGGTIDMNEFLVAAQQQPTIKKYFASLAAISLETQAQSATRVQRWIRGWLMRRRWGVTLKRLRQQKEDAEVAAEAAAARRLQAVVRGRQARGRVVEDLQAMEEAVMREIEEQERALSATPRPEPEPEPEPQPKTLNPFAADVAPQPRTDVARSRKRTKGALLSGLRSGALQAAVAKMEQETEPEPNPARPASSASSRPVSSASEDGDRVYAEPLPMWSAPAGAPDRAAVRVPPSALESSESLQRYAEDMEVAAASAVRQLETAQAQASSASLKASTLQAEVRRATEAACRAEAQLAACKSAAAADAAQLREAIERQGAALRSALAAVLSVRAQANAELSSARRAQRAAEKALGDVQTAAAAQETALRKELEDAAASVAALEAKLAMREDNLKKARSLVQPLPPSPRSSPSTPTRSHAPAERHTEPAIGRASREEAALDALHAETRRLFDGVIANSRARASPEIMAEFDKNGDGSLDAGEQKKLADAAVARGADRAAVARQLAQADTNEDGAIDQDELRRLADESGNGVFEL